MNQIVSHYFTHIVSGPDENINLAEAALHIALIEYPQLDIAAYLSRLDSMASELKSHIQAEASAASIISGINDYLFSQLGFSGNWRNFNDPKNSYLSDVLDRKLGIPISLAFVYMEMGRRLGLSMQGISFPGHFLLKFIHDQKDYVIDAFSGGVVLQEPALLERLQHFSTASKSRWDMQTLLTASGKKLMLVRMLRNLINIYIERDDFQRALPLSTVQLILEPDSPDALRDRGFIYDRLDCHRAASEDFQRYLLLNPAAADGQAVQARLRELQDSISRLH